jgi:hypothetical protein
MAEVQNIPTEIIKEIIVYKYFPSKSIAQKKYVDSHKEKIKEIKKAYYERNKEKIIQKQKEYNKIKKQKDNLEKTIN